MNSCSRAKQSSGDVPLRPSAMAVLPVYANDYIALTYYSIGPERAQIDIAHQDWAQVSERCFREYSGSLDQARNRLRFT